MSTIVEILSQGGIGAALGAVMGFIEKPIAQYMSLKQKKEENRHIEQLQNLQHDHDKIMADKELLSDEVKADASTLIASYEHDSSHGETYKWVVAICKLTRPAALVLTFFGSFWDPMMLPYFGLILAWWTASRARPNTPN